MRVDQISLEVKKPYNDTTLFPSKPKYDFWFLSFVLPTCELGSFYFLLSALFTSPKPHDFS